ncbi:MAG TPA: hypothetical protein PLU73_04810, partial [Bacteroidia bacterium]|nr:hypothetical protein [Bacteroidia bacterium]
MKKIITSICLISALPIALLLKQAHKESKKEVENMEAPYEYFAFMRSYPDKEFDLKAYNAMLDETSKQNYAARSNMPLSWNNEGPTN